MKIGIDSYCFHRYFGEICPGLQDGPTSRSGRLDRPGCFRACPA
ncbi:MAG: hypothetical protein ACLPXU_10920 [Acidimicrobiales bacterium]